LTLKANFMPAGDCGPGSLTSTHSYRIIARFPVNKKAAGTILKTDHPQSVKICLPGRNRADKFTQSHHQSQLRSGLSVVQFTIAGGK